MAVFKRYVMTIQDPGLQYLLPLSDEENARYKTVRQVAEALAAGKRLFAYVNFKEGDAILDLLLNDSCFELFTERKHIRPELLSLAEKMRTGQSVVVQGQSLMCRGATVFVFGGYGKSERGKTWAITETDTHQKPPLNLLKTMLSRTMIRPEVAVAWMKLPPEGCGHRKDHFLADPTMPI